MRNFPWVFLLVLWVLVGCSGRQLEIPRTRVARTNGGAVALSADERIAVVTNRSAGIVTVFVLAPENGLDAKKMIVRKTELDTGAGSEPWAAVIGLDDDTAYVLFRSSQQVGRLSSLRSTPVFDAHVSVGSEPSAIAITPSGQRLFVANWGEGTLSSITTRDFTTAIPIDLNHVLVDTNVLGAVTSRPALAHPRALAMTDNGDDIDDDETLYATEFFSQPFPNAKDPTDVDRNRQGFVYPVSVRSGRPGEAISIAPVDATGFEDGNGDMTGCFPNQLYAAAVENGQLYVTSMCTSPKGPLGAKAKDGTATDRNFKTLFHPAVFEIDTATNAESPEKGRLLTQVLDADYQADTDTMDERMPLIPNDIAFGAPLPTGSRAYVSALGADALFPLDYDSEGALQGIGVQGARYIDVKSTLGLPIGVAVSRSSARPFALAVTDANQRLSIVDLATQQTSYVNVDNERAVEFLTSDANTGHGFFGTGRDVWSFKGQAWSSCESCHPNGLSDGVTWFFARGPRRTISTAGTYEKTSEPDQRARRMLLWGANIDELHDVEAIVRGVSGGVGAALWEYGPNPTNDCRVLYDGSAPVPSNQGPCYGSKTTTDLQNGLNGSLADLDPDPAVSACQSEDASCDKMVFPDWRQIDAFIRAERAPAAPTQLLSDDVAAGKSLFFEGGKCAGCHGGPGWTVSRLFYKPGAAQNGELPYKASAGALKLGALRSDRYKVPPDLLVLNPPALAGGGSATFRNMPADTSDESMVSAFVYTGANQTDDQIRCALRDVGTFPEQTPMGNNFTSVAPVGAQGVPEYRQDMSSLAQGQTGFNVPSLFGLSVGAPYFHAGNARTLEEVFDAATFARHHQALAADFLSDPLQRAQQLQELVAFLLSIDETTAIAPVPDTDDFCPL